MVRMYRVRSFAAVFVATMLCVGVSAQGAGGQPAPTPPIPNCTSTSLSCNMTTSVTKPVQDPSTGNLVPATTSSQVQVVNTPSLGSPYNWQGLNWGVGLATDFDLSGKRVTTAVLDSAGLVRVTDSSGNVGISFVLEAHYFAWDWPAISGCNQFGMYGCTEVAVGPFVAVEVGNQSSNNGPINGYALGMMVGLHRPNPPAADPTNPPKASNSTWNFGVGLRVDPSAQVLADGAVVGHAPPPGISSSADLIKKEPRYGVMLMSSFSF